MLLASILAAAIATPAAASVGPPAGTKGEDTPVRLRWAAPPGCPDADAVRSWILALIPALPAASPGADATATVRVTSDGFAVDVDVELGPDGEALHTARTLQSDDCELLARATAVVIAVGLDPLAVASSLGDASATAREPTPSPAIPAPELVIRGPAVPASDDAATGPRPRRASSFEYGVGAGTGIGGFLLPGVGIGVTIAPFFGTRRLHIQAVAQYWLPQQVAAEDTRDVRAALQMATAGARVCPLLSWGRVRLELCAGVDAGGVFGRGRGAGLEATRVATDPWAGVVLAPGVRLAVARRVSVGLALEGAISLYRPRFAVEGIPEDLWTVAAGGLRGLFSVQVHRPRENR